MAKAQITGAAIVRAIQEESQQTRRGVTADMTATLVNAGGKNDRARVGKMLALLRDEGSLTYDQGRYWATEQGLAGAVEQPEPTPANDEQVAEPKIPLCADCDAALSADELEFYETRCEACELATEYDEPEEAGTVAHPPGATESGIGSMLDALVAGADPATHHDQALQAEVVELLDGLIERTHDRITLMPDESEPLRELLAHCESIRARTVRAFFVPAELLGRREASQ
ncbi:hypothetical protein R6258_07775 [Halomonas sp. HP20-15]|uniref:hypothetical protein n=1 Tax=Halomonas sp. HP20-15 TaxID=3085901 RepID=UPI0029829EB5|nr:hypothetical protein [Halomonas sp. HP20-15]MDW5376818.1 hypothetical protein [Halomonas sp. HP20-15]